MRPSVLAALGLAAALFVGAGTFVALDSRLGASDTMDGVALPASDGAADTDGDEPEISIEAVDADSEETPAAEGTPSVSETPRAEPPPPDPEPQQPERQRPQTQPEPQPQAPQPQPRPQPEPQPPVAAEPACDPTPLIRRITQLTTRDCPAHTDPDRKRACYAEIERLNSQLADCSS